MRMTLVALVALLGGSSSLVAHHSTAMYDMAHPITFSATVKSFDWVNPHSYIHVDVITPDGKTEAWDVETHSISLLTRKGWTRNSFKPGDVITVTGGQMKNGTKMMRLVRGVKADGWKFYGDDFGGNQPPTRQGGQ